MTRLIRGKVIADNQNGSERSAEEELSSSRRIPDDDASGENATNSYRDGDTFASPAAPWVGAEAAWQQGIVPPPHEDWVHYKTRIARSNRQDDIGDLALSDEEAATVLSTLPPPSKEQTLRPKLFSRLSKFAAAAALTAVTAWAVSGVLSRETKAKTPTVVVRPAVSAEAPAFSPDLSDATPETAMPAENTTPDVAPESNTASDLNVAFDNKDENIETAEQVEAPSLAPARRRAASRKRAAAKAKKLEASSALRESRVSDVSDIAPTPETEGRPSLSARTAEAPAETEQPSENAFVSRGDSNAFSAPKSQPKPNDVPPLSRETVRRVMSGLEREVLKCSNGQKGRIVIELTVSGVSGRVKNAVTRTEAFADKPTGICAERAMSLAKFPKFDEEDLTIKYPFEF